MASHFSDVGFDFENCEDNNRFVDKAFDQAEIYELPRGRTALYRPRDGIQYWFPLNDAGEALDYNFHFESSQANDIQVMECLQPGPGGLSGLYGCQADLAEEDGRPVPEVPLNLYLPAAGLMGELAPGARYKAQIACFAEEIMVYANRRAYDTEMEKGSVKLALEHFIPVGTFRPGQDTGFEQSPHAMLGGRVQASRRLANPVTGRAYDHLQLSGMGMKYDALIDPVMYGGLPQPGAVVHGVFWMSALVWAVRDEANPAEGK